VQGRERVASLHDAGRRDEIGDDFAGRVPVQVAGVEVVGRINDDPTIPVEALSGLW
jgi:hypothetical protein